MRAESVDPHKKALRVLDLAGDGQLEVVLSLFTGGAHCCVVEQIYTPGTSRGTYIKDEHEFDAGAIVTDIGNKRPLRVRLRRCRVRLRVLRLRPFRPADPDLELRQPALPDRDRGYPGLIRADAAKWMRAFHQSISNGVGLIAAWAADEDRLGNSKLVSTTLDGLGPQGQAAQRRPELRLGPEVRRPVAAVPAPHALHALGTHGPLGLAGRSAVRLLGRLVGRSGSGLPALGRSGCLSRLRDVPIV